MGSFVGLTAYVWLLKVAPISLVATYAYVNPVVAVLIGWALLDEDFTALDAPRGRRSIVVAVAMIVSAPAPEREHGRGLPPAVQAPPAARATEVEPARGPVRDAARRRRRARTSPTDDRALHDAGAQAPARISPTSALLHDLPLSSGADDLHMTKDVLGQAERLAAGALGRGSLPLLRERLDAGKPGARARARRGRAMR